MNAAAFFTNPATTPASRTVNAGTTVNWQNDSGIIHNVVFANPSAAGAVGTGPSGNIADHSSGTNSRVFAATGSQGFHCTIHGTPTSGMFGTVVVQ